jgi:putative ABC transport system permease protein
MNSIILRISIRNLLKNKLTSFVYIFGLSLGFIAFILISLFIRYELSWDKTNEDFSRIFLIQRNISQSINNIGSANFSPSTPQNLSLIINSYTDIEAVTTINEIENSWFSTNQIDQIKVEKGIYADTSYLNIFTYKLRNSISTHDFNEPYTAIISETLANKLFGDKLAVGQTVTLDKETDLKVIGVYEDLPQNSSIRPDFIVSFSTLQRKNSILASNRSTFCLTFVKLKSNASAIAFEESIKDLLLGFEGMETETLHLTPLSKVRFDSVPDYYRIIWIFGLIGLFIVSMSAFNYINLTIANSSIRGKEIAIKKMNGSSRVRLIAQFIGETIVLSLISIAISFYLVVLILPFYNNLMNTEITLNFINDLKFIVLIISCSVAIGFIAGIYPAFFMSSRNIVSLFKKGLLGSDGNKMFVRKILVLLQFVISTFLICLSILFMIQVNHLSTKDIGFNRDNIIFVKLSSNTDGINFNDFRNRILQNPHINNASMSKNLPFVNFNSGQITWEGSSSNELLSIRPNWVSHDFISTLGIKLTDGRNFSYDFASDINQACIINQSAARYFGWDNPIGKRLDNNQLTIVGVVKDYHIMDIHNPIEPVVLRLTPNDMKGNWVLSFRYESGFRDDAKRFIEKTFSETFPNDLIEINDLENAFLNENAYVGYQTVKKSILLFTLFSILLAAMGLLGLVSFTTAKRTKEIGIRKILGSSIPNIFLLLNREFLILLCISLIIAWPAVWYVWSVFPGVYKLPFQPLVIILSSTIIILITLITTGWQTWNAAQRNPIDALRYE